MKVQSVSLPFRYARQESRDFSAYAGFPCDESAELGDTMKQTPCITEVGLNYIRFILCHCRRKEITLCPVVFIMRNE
jgi:hypothetical protein